MMGAETEAVGQRERYRARKETLAEEIVALGAEEQKLALGVTTALVEGFEAEAVKARRREVQQDLEESRRALEELDGMIAGAEEDAEAIRREAALEVYWAARTEEGKAAEKLARVVEKSLVPALKAFREASRAAHGKGSEARAETSNSYRRRLMLGENYLRTVLGPFYAELGTATRFQVESLTGRLGEVLPGHPRTEEEEEDDG